MIPQEFFIVTFAANLIFSLVLVVIGLWGYRRIGSPVPLYFGIAYIVFAISHGLMLIPLTEILAVLLILMRTAGYILVAFGLFALLVEVYERQRAEEAARESEEHFAATFEQTSVGMVEFSPDGRISRYNRRFSTILGCSADEWLSRTIWDNFVPASHTLDTGAISRVIRGDAAGYTGEMLLLRRDRTSVWCQVSLSAVRSADGALRYFILVVEDITARKEAESQVALLYAGLENRVAERTRELNRANAALQAEIRRRATAEDELRALLHEKEILLAEIGDATARTRAEW